MDFELSDQGPDYLNESCLIPFRLTQSAPEQMTRSASFTPNLKTTKLWSSKENQILMSIVPDIERKQWKNIARQLANLSGAPLKSAAQVSQHYRRTLLADVRQWTSEEDQLLVSLAQANNSWSNIAQSFLGRSDQQIKYRYSCILRQME